VPILICVTVKNGINSAKITEKELISTNQLNYKAPEKSHATEVLVGYIYNFFFCFLGRAFFNDEENNQKNALINSSINLLMSDHSDMFRLPS
jgi:hypothetical protein